MYLAGATLEDVAQRYDCSRTAVRSAVKAAGHRGKGPVPKDQRP
jgi:transposase-like protein